GPVALRGASPRRPRPSDACVDRRDAAPADRARRRQLRARLVAGRDAGSADRRACGLGRRLPVAAPAGAAGPRRRRGTHELEPRQRGDPGRTRAPRSGPGAGRRTGPFDCRACGADRPVPGTGLRARDRHRRRRVEHRRRRGRPVQPGNPGLSNGARTPRCRAGVRDPRRRMAKRALRFSPRRIRTLPRPSRRADRVTSAIAAGHPATVEAGIEMLRAGGSAADAAVAASLASCVAETVMTGLLGGGHAIYYDGTGGSAENLDFFVAVPGLGAERREAALLELDVPFGAELVHYAVGIASCGVPGVPAGLAELWRRHGRLEWTRLVEPALRLARAGVEMTPAQSSCLAMLATVMTMNEGARIYAPRGSLLAAGERLEQPGLVRALELLAEEGAASAYSGSIADVLLALMRERGGLVTREDLEAYRA